MALKISNFVHSLVYNLSRTFFVFLSYGVNYIPIFMETQLSWYHFIKRPFHHLLIVSLSKCPHIWYLFLWLLLHLSLCLHHILLSPNIKGHKGWHFLQSFTIFVLTFKCVAQFKLNFVNSWIKNFGSLFCMWTFSCPGTEISFFC